MCDEELIEYDEYESYHCEILNDNCPYDYPCSLCRLCKEYEAAKEYAARRKEEVE